MATSSSTSLESSARETVQQLFSFIEAQGQGDYLGESVSQIAHSLQCATLAQQAGADNETVIGALLHDVGRFIPAAAKMESMIASDGTYIGKASHEVLGERHLRHLGFSEKICQLVGAHVMAKRYLCAVDEKYWEGLSRSSKRTLEFQGGTYNTEQVRIAQQDPLLEDKLAVRRWDDRAKDPNFQTPPLSAFEDITVQSLIMSRSHIELHGRTYQLPTKPTVAVCVDGFDPEYLEQGIKDGIIPNLEKMTKEGFHAPALCAMPSLTIPNNVSIITGAPISKHGMLGNYYLDRKTGKEEMILDDALLIGDTLLELMSKRGVRVAAVTAKDKLRAILKHGLENAICFSSEKAGSCTMETNGITDVESWLGQPQPSMYSGTLSLYVMDVGIKLLEEDRADLFYLTLSDYIQHKYAPGSKESNEFLAALDQRIGRLVELGADVAVSGDHGMSDKCHPDGTPNVLFLEDALAEKWGASNVRVICPIADPFVKHHGAFGGFVRVYAKREDDIDDMLRFCQTLPQVEVAMSSKEASEKFELPLEREGDIVVISTADAAIGSRKDEHDMSNVTDHRLRTHGSLAEQGIPLLMSRPAKQAGLAESRQWRNFDIYDLLLNH